MIIPAKPIKITDTNQLNRIFIRFIDKNGIQIESESDIPKIIDMFVKAVDEFLKTEWEDD